MVVISSDRAVQSLLLPLDDVFEGSWFVPDSVGYEAILVGESPHMLAVNISSCEAQIRQFFSGYAIWIKIGIDSRNASLVGSVEFGNGVPDLSLYFEIVLEILDNIVVSFSVGFVVILVEL